MNATQDVLDLIADWSAAELAGDEDGCRALLTDDFLGVGAAGFVLDAARWAGRHRSDLRNHELEIFEPRVRVHGDTAVVDAVQRQVTTARGHDASGSFRIVVVCTASANGWRIAHLQLSGPLIPTGQMPSFARPVPAAEA